MKWPTVILVLSVAIAGTGCIHPPDQPPEREAYIARLSADMQAGVITLSVGRRVTTEGEQRLRAPFTIEHAIQQAGGINKIEEDWGSPIMVTHRDGRWLRVPRKYLASYVLSDGDRVYVPRR